MKKNKKEGKNTVFLKIIGGIVLAGFVASIIYSVYYYQKSDIEETGLETCDASGCRISVHWHATLERMSVCGQIVERSWETGDLDGPHTHKDNRMHVHTILPIDPQTKQLLEPYPMTLGGFFDSIKWKFSENCFKDTCDTCNGEPATTHLMVNGKPVENFRDYVWKDGDKVRVTFN